MDVSEAIYRCDRLLELLEQDREELSEALEGDLLVEYQKCMDLEMDVARRIRKKILSCG
ncbi:MAG: hypothetical protein LUF35_07515 [Lachnospiraceae bacterium]|nr:hypothetical protein [Lachnospiraceae bacterium]